MVTTAMFRSLSVSVLYNNCAVLPHPGCEAISINTLYGTLSMSCLRRAKSACF